MHELLINGKSEPLIEEEIFLIDHHDSFTFNLFQLLGKYFKHIRILQTGEFNLSDIAGENPLAIVLSPGPGHPLEKDETMKVVEYFSHKCAIFGVCLGMQIIVSHFGGNIIQSGAPKHGKISRVLHNSMGLFTDIPQLFNVTRYHSLIAEEKTMNRNLRVDAKSEDGIIMGISHTQLPVCGVQYHPEAYLTEYGSHLIRNWIKLYLTNR